MLTIIGLVIGVVWANFKHIDMNTFKLFGFEVKILKPEKRITDVIPFKKKEKVVATESKKECELCHDQDLYINKSIMMCPKCQRNKSRVKSV